MKPLHLLCIAALAVLPACESTTGGFNSSDLFIAYTGSGVEVQNMAITAAPGQEAVTANGVGYDTKKGTGYVTYLDGHRTKLRITGGGFGGGVAAIVLDDGSKIKVNMKTGAVTTEPPLPQK